MTNWAVTGATGFVGRAVLQRLAALTPEGGDGGVVRGVLALTRGGKQPQPVTFASIRYITVGNLEEPVAWQPVLAGVDILVHTAARVHVKDDNAFNPLDEFRRVNVLATLHLARQAAAVGVRRFVFISSIGVNGQLTDPGQPFSEANAVSPHSDYSLSKWEAEQGLKQIAEQTGMELVVIRPPLVYGPNAPGNFGTLVRAVQRGYILPLGAVYNQRSLVGIDNLVDFIITCAIRPQAANQMFLVSDGHDLSTTELIEGIARAAEVPARLLPVPVPILRSFAAVLGKAVAVDRLCGSLQVDISKARVLLGWVPPLSVWSGLKAVFV